MEKIIKKLGLGLQHQKLSNECFKRKEGRRKMEDFSPDEKRLNRSFPSFGRSPLPILLFSSVVTLYSIEEIDIKSMTYNANITCSLRSIISSYSL